MSFLGKIKIDEDVRNLVQGEGLTFNEAIEKKYYGEIQDAKANNSIFKDLSPTKLAIISAGLNGNDRMNAMMTTEDNRFLFPAFMAELVDKTIYRTDILQDLIGGESGTSSRTVEYPIIDLLSGINAKNSKQTRVAEGAETSYRTLEIEEGSFKLNKKMIGSKITYEAMRDMKIDLFSRLVQSISSDITRQNITDVASVIEKAENQNLLTTANSNIITNAEFIKATTEYQDLFGVAPEIVVVGKELYESFANMAYDSNQAYGVNSRLSIMLPQLDNKPIKVLKVDKMKDGEKNIAKLYTKDTAPQRWLQTGSSLTEYDTNIANQTQRVIISEISGYSNMVKQYGTIKSK